MADGMDEPASPAAASVVHAHTLHTTNRMDDPIVLQCTPSLVGVNAWVTHIFHARKRRCMTALQTCFRTQQRNWEPSTDGFNIMRSAK
jgi:hypothetical protein